MENKNFFERKLKDGFCGLAEGNLRGFAARRVCAVVFAAAMLVLAGCGSVSPAPVFPENLPPGQYKVRDKGPSGGWIVWDKGNNDGGWRYLEAAPENLEFPVDRTKLTTTVQPVLDQAKSLGNGWRVPTATELNYMYYVLHLNGKGDFEDRWYMYEIPAETRLDKRTGLGGQNFKNGKQATSFGSSSSTTYEKGADGQVVAVVKENQPYVRPVRQF